MRVKTPPTKLTQARPSSGYSVPANCAATLRLWIFPVAVLGSDSTKVDLVGHLEVREVVAAEPENVVLRRRHL